jgi:ribose 5-phosphate isomerase A
MTIEDQKRAAALAALEHIKSGMKVGLGTGTTANHFISALGEKAKSGLDVICVATSKQSHELAKAVGLKVATLDQHDWLDVTVDGADEVDPQLNLIKGGGGSLLYEKIVATSSKNMIVIADQSKRVVKLGNFPLPVEIVPFGYKATAWKLQKAFDLLKLKPKMTLRVKDGKPFVTDGRHAIIDCAVGEIPDPQRLDAILNTIPGVVETGTFIRVCKLLILGTPKGVETVKAQ